MMYHFFELSILPFLGLRRQRMENVGHSELHNSVDYKKEESEEKHCRNYYESRSRHLTPPRPGDIIELFAGFFQKINDIPKRSPKFCKKILHLLSSANSQPAALESGTGTAS
jgi:hypothetical protein